jgi:uncharacterized protein
MNALRVVIDTNIVISAALKPGGLESQIIELVIAREITLCASTAVFAEYESVLGRPKFARVDPTHIARLLKLLKSEATMVEPRESVTESMDESDNRFLECAETANADYLVTGNARHFPKRWKITKILNAREFLSM